MIRRDSRTLPELSRIATRRDKKGRRALLRPAQERSERIERSERLVHPAHAAAVWHRGRFLLLLWNLRDERFSRERQRGNRGCVVQRAGNYLGGMDHARLDGIFLGVGGSIVPLVL